MKQPHIVVIGGGIAGLAAAYRLQKDGHRSRLIEASPRFGGKILTEREDGFVIEGGPDSFVVHKPQALELVRELGLEDRLLPSNDERRGDEVTVNVHYHGEELTAEPCARTSSCSARSRP